MSGASDIKAEQSIGSGIEGIARILLGKQDLSALDKYKITEYAFHMLYRTGEVLPLQSTDEFVLKASVRRKQVRQKRTKLHSCIFHEYGNMENHGENG